MPFLISTHSASPLIRRAHPIGLINPVSKRPCTLWSRPVPKP